MLNLDCRLHMGGFGSGRHRYAWTPTVGASMTIAVADLKDVVERPGRRASVTWGDGADPRARIGVEAVDEATPRDVDADRDVATDRLDEYDDGPARAVRLQYRARPDTSDDAIAVDERIRVAYTTPPVGGLRPYWVCRGCDERRTELHLPPWDRRPGRTPTRFRCRECHDLGYETSRASGTHMKEPRIRYQRAFARADARNRRPHPNSLATPERPTGRHEMTHEDLVADVERAREKWSAAFDRGLKRYAPDDRRDELDVVSHDGR